jgi:hypothetical protein
VRTEREQSGTWRATNGDGAYLVGYETRALAMAAGTREWLGFQHGHEIRASDPEPVDVFAPLRWTLENAQRIDRDLRSAGVDVAENAKERCEEQARAMLAEVARLREELRRANYDAAMFERDAARKGDRLADLEHARACLLGDVEEPPPGPAMTE